LAAAIVQAPVSSWFDHETPAIVVHCKAGIGCCLVFGAFIIANWIFEMQHPPLVSSAPRQPEKRPRPPPMSVKTAIKLMVHGGDDGVPLGLIEAAKAVQLKPPTLRRYFDRPAVIGLLRAERRQFIATLIAGNPAALARIRDTAENSMSQCKAIDLLEGMGDEAAHNRTIMPPSPHLTIVIRQPDRPTPAVTTIEARPEPEETTDPWDATKPLAEPHFKWPRD
jgi:hypothetical protein